MLIDSTGLGFSIRDGELLVHYPTRRVGASDADSDDHSPGSHYGAGTPIGPIPTSYMVDPPNAITAERSRLWEQLRRAAD